MSWRILAAFCGIGGAPPAADEGRAICSKQSASDWLIGRKL
jgi:hypothetical protein